MQSLSIASVLKHAETYLAANKRLQINGWIRTRRSSKAGLAFLSITDGSTGRVFQAIVPAELENYASILNLTTGCSVSLWGRLQRSPGAEQAYELLVDTAHILGQVADPETYPVSPKKHSLEHLRSVAHLRPRTQLIGAVTRIRHRLAQAIHQYFHEEGFFWINTPVITGLDCEGAGETFRVSTLPFDDIPRHPDGRINFSKDFFSKETFLTVSGQLNAEAYACAMSKVYTFGPTFRAEPSNTARHLAEFWMIEPEMAFSDLNSLQILAVGLLKHVASHLLRDASDDLQYLQDLNKCPLIERLITLEKGSVISLEYTEAIEILTQSRVEFEYPVYWGIDLAVEHERFLVERHFQSPVAVRNYPKAIKAFYMRINEDERTVAAMDLLVPGLGELIGGSQREERYEVLVGRLQECGLPLSVYKWYVDLRRYGTVEHAGFGLGFERLLAYVCGLGNLRDAIPFPRVPRSAEF